ncbi:MAG: type VI secretion system contractile sheath large subunit [Rhodospirillales bacterium]|nr:type VI secretion system contractile sheath large subunit [Rhodospirillales bacterium]
MKYEVNFGRIGGGRRPAASGKKFRLALLGDFSGRANAGTLETGEALAARKPIRVDVDNLDDVIARMEIGLALNLTEDGGAVAVPIASMEDFHPDQLAANVSLFDELRGLRRNLANKVGFEKAAKQVMAWGGAEMPPPPPRRARGSAVAARKLSDFADLVGRPAAPDPDETAIDDLVARLVGPFIKPARDPRQDVLIAQVDEALSGAMRRVLHHPDFQTAEALWRGVEMLVRRIETSATMEIVLYDVSAEELAADLAATETLEDAGLYGMLVEKPAQDAHQGALSAVIGLYDFELAPPHADLLGRIASIAAAAGAPFVAAIGPDALATPMHLQNPLIQDAFGALFEAPQSVYLGLATPRFLMRLPYGKKTDPIDAFAFEEFTRQEGLSGMLWGHPALIPALLLAETYAQQGTKMRLGTVMGVGDIAYYVYTAPDGEQVALPCTERLYSERQAIAIAQYKVMPLLSLRGKPELRLGGFTSIGGTPLAGFWAPAGMPPPAPAAAPARPAPAAREAEPEEAEAEEVEAAPSETETTASEAPAEAEEVDLDKLLADLNADPPPAAEGETEPDLDALLASLK